MRYVSAFRNHILVGEEEKPENTGGLPFQLQSFQGYFIDNEDYFPKKEVFL